MLLSDTTLNHSAGKTSFENMRTVDNVLHDTYKETCRALGLLKDDVLWYLVMEDAKQQKLPSQMRELFVILMIFSDVNDAKSLFEAFSESMAEDFDHQVRTIEDVNPQLQHWMLLVDIKERLESTGNGMLFQRIGEVTEEMLLAVATANRQYNLHGEFREIREELAYDKEEMEDALFTAMNGEGPEQNGKFTPSQEEAFKSITDAIEGKSQKKTILH